MNLDMFFNPKSIAVIGASSNPKKIGRVVFDTLVSNKKKVFPINPNAELINGMKCYPSLTSLNHDTGRPELIVVAVPVEETLKTLEEAGKLGIRNAVIITAGFKEMGNADAEKKLESICGKYKINVIGPNCLGILDMHSGMDAVFLPPNKLQRPKKGDIAFITQSGATGSVALDVLHSLGVSKFISYGNALNLDESDFLNYLNKDAKTRVICMYMEAVRNGEKFFKTMKSMKKPVIVLKGGKSKEGTKATISHTGSLAGDAAIYSGIFKQAKFIEVNGMKEMIDVIELVDLTKLKEKRNASIGVITNGGGYGILCVDHLLGAGLNYEGPVSDLFGDATPEGYRKALATMDTDVIICNVLFQTPLVDESLIDIVAKANKKKKIVVVSTGSEYVQTMKQRLIEKGVCVFDTPEEAVDALKAVLHHE